MKKSISLFVFIIIGLTAMAQERPPKDDRPKPPSPTEMLQRISKDVNLTEVQLKQFKTFLDAQEAKPRPTESERNERGENDRKEMDLKLKSILTQAQYKKWQETKPKRKPMGDKPEGKPRKE